MERIKKIIKNNLFVQKLYIIFGSVFFFFLRLFFPVKKNRILFSSMSGNNYNFSSPFYIYKALEEQYGTKYEYVWAFSDKQKATGYFGKRVKIDTFKYFTYVLTSKIWITDVNIERGLKLKRKKQYYVNTWHGGITKGYPKTRKDYKLTNVDIFCSDGQKYEDFFTKYYKVQKSSYLRCGRPREDTIFECESNKDLLRSKFGFSKQDYIILYMPTWRENDCNAYLDLSSIVDCLPNVVAVFHSHNLGHLSQKGSANIYDFSNIDDLNSLYAISDLLISDYSSCIYDFLLLKKPVLLFAKDYDDYSSTRGLAVDFKNEFPFSISKTENELIDKIKVVKNGFNLFEYQKFLQNVVEIDRKQSATKVIIEKMKRDGVVPYEN